MKKIDCSPEMELEVFHETLENGLDIYLVPMPHKDKYYITYGTYFGSVTTTFKPHGEKKFVTVPDGIAHFLEHKMFEEESGEDPFTFFSKSGTDVNAATNYDSTRYIAVGTKNFKENLKYLIHFVNHPYFTDENVEKEKGIIAQEINMYKDEAEFAIEDSVRRNTYIHDNHKNDIAGEVSDIEKITKEDLYLCYDNFYQPRNMFLVVVGDFSMEEAKTVIREDLKPLTNKTEEPVVKEIHEPVNIRKNREKVPFNISIPKIMMSIKTPKSAFSLEDEVKLDLYLNIMNDLAFGQSSSFKERVINENLMTRFYSDLETVTGYKTIYLYGESARPDELISEIVKELDNIEISLDDLNRMRKVYIASLIKRVDYVDGVMSSLVSVLVRYHKLVPNPIEIYRSMNLKELQEVLKSIRFQNRAVVTYYPQDIPRFQEKESEKQEKKTDE